MSEVPVSSIHISKERLWLPRKALSLPLHVKSLCLVDPEGAEHHVTMLVEEPLSPSNEGMLALCIVHAFLEKSEAGQGVSIRTPRSSGWAAYLDEAAATKIEGAPECCDFVLRLTE